MNDSFFDAFGDEIHVDWSQISEGELDHLVQAQQSRGR